MNARSTSSTVAARARQHIATSQLDRFDDIVRRLDLVVARYERSSERHERALARLEQLLAGEDDEA